jgi:hypothetical protein
MLNVGKGMTWWISASSNSNRGPEKVAQDFIFLSALRRKEYDIKPETGVGYGLFVKTRDNVANWADNLILYTYG